MKIHSLFASLVLTMLCACQAEKANDSQSDSLDDLSRQLDSQEYSDLKMFELHGPVKLVEKTTFYSVRMDENNVPVADTTAANCRTTELYFDKIGNYVPTENEKIKRDEKGRITHWRDARPTVKNVHPGLMMDSLRYTHINNNVLQSKGIGEFAVTIFDNDGNIVGQYSKPEQGEHTTAFNIPLQLDENGNWIERLTVWTSAGNGEQPHVSYTLDRRTISYY